jgi:hypothetical protein
MITSSQKKIKKLRSIHADFPFYKKKFNGDNKLVSYLIETLYKKLEREPTKFFVEFGVHSGDTGIFCDHLIKKNYQAILIDQSDLNINKLKEDYKYYEKNLTFITKTVSDTGPNSLDNILKETSCPEIFDLLLIDIDSIDYQVWQSLKNYKPNFVIIEFNEYYGPDLEIIHNKELNNWVGEASFCKGSSIKSIVNLAKTKNYSLITTTRQNAFFVKKDFFHAFSLTDIEIKDTFDFSYLNIENDKLSLCQIIKKYYIYLFSKIKKNIINSFLI